MQTYEKTSQAATSPEMIGEIIVAARQIEGKLHSICGCTEVTGIHALTELLGNRLPEEVKIQLHSIASIRNHAAHEDDFQLSPENLERFRKNVEQVTSVLDALFPASSCEDTEQHPSSDKENNWETRLAVEREVCREMADKLTFLGYFPILGNVFLLYLLIYTLCMQGLLLILITLYCCSAVLGIHGLQSAQERGLLYVAGGAFVFAFAATAVIAWRSPLKHLPKALTLLPGINIIYLILRWLRDLAWGRFLLTVAGLSAFIISFKMLLKSQYSYAAMLLLANWVIGIICVFIWGSSREK